MGMFAAFFFFFFYLPFCSSLSLSVTLQGFSYCVFSLLFGRQFCLINEQDLNRTKRAEEIACNSKKVFLTLSSFHLNTFCFYPSVSAMWSETLCFHAVCPSVHPTVSTHGSYAEYDRVSHKCLIGLNIVMVFLLKRSNVSITVTFECSAKTLFWSLFNPELWNRRRDVTSFHIQSDS